MKKNKKQIIYKSAYDPEFAEKLLAYIYDYADLHPSLKTTFLAITKHFKIDFLDTAQINKLRLHLRHLCDEMLIEEEHYLDGVVSYDMESKGIKWVNKLRETKS
jgi:hypothetical protein